MRSIIKKIKGFIDNGVDPLNDEMLSDLEYTKVTENEVEIAPKLRREPERIKNRKLANALYTVSAIALCFAMIVILTWNVNGLPFFGGADTLVDSEVGRFYIENGLKDTGATNIITPIILSYRGFDTLGESHVLFIAMCAVLILLRSAPVNPENHLQAYDAAMESDEPWEDDILKAFGRVLMVLIFVFGLYIILNGNTSPGGGFSGGAVLGAGFILYLNVFGHSAAVKFLNFKTMQSVTAAALVSYSIFKGYHFITGFNEIESIFGNGTPGTIFSGGMMLYLNIFVGAVVSMTMYSLFVMFRKGDF